MPLLKFLDSTSVRAAERAEAQKRGHYYRLIRLNSDSVSVVLCVVVIVNNANCLPRTAIVREESLSVTVGQRGGAAAAAIESEWTHAVAVPGQRRGAAERWLRPPPSSLHWQALRGQSIHQEPRAMTTRFG